MSGQFRVDPAALETASSVFRRQHQALVDAITSFQNRALDVNDAFGWLGPSIAVLREYESATETAFRAFDHMASLLSGAAQGLVTTADNYRLADGASNPPVERP